MVVVAWIVKQASHVELLSDAADGAVRGRLLISPPTPTRVAETGRRTYVDTLGAVCSVHVAPSQYLCSCSLFGSGYQTAGTDGGGTGGGVGEESG